tara:strand:+ start:228 stop:1073 length:846 start_codon:yes stop_codon:yes gene_type:complete
MEKHYEIKTQLRNKFALHMLRVDLPTDFIENINNYIDEELIPLDENYGKVKGNAELQHSYSKGLVGQIRQDDRSAQLDCQIFDTERGKLLKSTLDTCSKEYLRQIGHGTSHADVFEAWTVHSFAGDYNPLHDHGVLTPGGLSMILYLQVPECISKLPDPDDKGGNVWFNDNSGDIDGFTYFIWDQRNQDMLRKLYPVAEEYFKPKVGTLLVFPNWLKHAVMPFHGEGERRTLAANANIISPEMFDWDNSSEEDRQKLLTTLRNSRYRYGGGGGGLGAKTKD